MDIWRFYWKQFCPATTFKLHFVFWKISKRMLYEDAVELQGVHLDEPSSPIPQRWLKGDYDDLVSQLSNPLHHVTKANKPDNSSLTSSTLTAGGASPHYSIHSSSGTCDKQPPRASKICECTATSGVGFGGRGGGGDKLTEELHRKCKVHASSKTSSSGSSFTSSHVSPSALVSPVEKRRYFQSWRTSKAHKERPALTDSQQNRSVEGEEGSTDYSSLVSGCDSNISRSSTVSSTCSSNDLDEGFREVSVYLKKSATTTVLDSKLSFNCDSTPEMTDNEGSEENSAPKDSSETSSKKEKEPKKRRFRKMLPRPLHRSQSAGCTKDVPAHALFLQHRLGDKGIDTLEERLADRTSHSPDKDSERPKDWSSNSKPPHPPLTSRPIHKTTSADAAMMSREEYGGFSSQSKSKPRSIAKTMKRKLMFLRRRHTDTTLGTILSGDGKMVSKIQPEEALQWSRSFESLLSDKTGLELFRGFLRSEFSDENLEFWIACEEYKTSKPSKMSAMAQKIYADFVAAQAPREINLDAKTRVKTLANISRPSRDVFEDAQRKVQALMQKDSYPRFLESDVYQQIIHGQKS